MAVGTHQRAAVTAMVAVTTAVAIATDVPMGRGGAVTAMAVGLATAAAIVMVAGIQNKAAAMAMDAATMAVATATAALLSPADVGSATNADAEIDTSSFAPCPNTTGRRRNTKRRRSQYPRQDSASCDRY